MIPWQGPFHVSLNAEESTIQVFWPVFEKLYKALFGRLVKFRETRNQKQYTSASYTCRLGEAISYHEVTKIIIIIFPKFLEAKKPKSEKISLVSSFAFGGWMIVRDVICLVQVKIHST